MTDGGYRTLISAEELSTILGRPGLVVVDCRFSLADPPAGHRAYLEGHIPGAAFAHVEEDLSGPVTRGRTGRHPLPNPQVLAMKLGAWGIDHTVQVIAYDATGGSMAGRLWWLLHWLGHDRVAVLDGGWPAWLAGKHPVSAGTEAPRPREFEPRLRPELALDAQALDRVRSDRRWRVFDARAAERFRGENETIDPVAGHIPGAVSAPFADNLGPDGRFKSPEELRRLFAPLMESVPAEQVVCYCGSGITAVHDILAIAHAGFGEARLYPGSWSDWITDPSRPIMKG